MLNSRRLCGSFVVLIAVAVLLSTSAGAQRPSEGGNSATKGSRAPAKLTQQQADNIQERIATTTRIVDRLEPEAKALGRASGWRQATIDALLSLSLSQLHQIEQQPLSPDSLPAAISSTASDPQVLGGPNSDLVYTPITPCRFSDTRIVGGKINGFRGYDLDNNGAVYGGSAACNPVTLFGVANADAIPAVVMNVTLIDTTIAPGFVAVKPNAAAPISSLVNWYEVGPFVQNSNTGIATLEQDLAVADEFVVQTPAPVQVILDLSGVFLPPQATGLQQTFPTATASIPSGQFGFAISPACAAGYAMTGGQCSSSGPKPELNDLFIDVSGGWYCGGRNTGGGAMTLTATGICSRVPGR